MAEISYLSSLRSDMTSYLSDKLDSEYNVHEFYSDDALEAAGEFGDKYSRLTRSTQILLAVPSSVQQSFRGSQTAVQDRVRVALFVAANDNRDRTRAVDRVEEGVLVSQAYLSNQKWGVGFSHQGYIEGWEKTIELEDDEGVVYSLTGSINLELDLQTVITKYES